MSVSNRTEIRCYLIQHLGNPETTIVAGERYITRAAGAPPSERLAPDLLVAFDADPEAYRKSNGYIISEQDKPPDFVLEIASRSTGRQDTVDKRPAYAALVWCIRSSSVNKVAIDVATLLWFEQESGSISFQEAPD